MKTNQTIATALAKAKLLEFQIAAQAVTQTPRQQFSQLPKTKGLQEHTWENNLLSSFSRLLLVLKVKPENIVRKLMLKIVLI